MIDPDAHLKFTAASRRHGISRDQVREVVTGTIMVVEVRHPDSDHADIRWALVGEDATGTVIEVAVVELETAWLVIHAMPARPRLRRLYEEGRHDAP